MAPSLNSVHLKLARAETHLTTIRREIDEWWETKPITLVAEDRVKWYHAARGELGMPPSRDVDGQCVHRIFTVKLQGALPTHWSPLLGDVVHNLRSSLDHLVWQLAEPPIGTGGNAGNYFPIYLDGKNFEDGHLTKLKGLRPDAVNLVKSVKPYGGAPVGDRLVLLNALSRYDKHRLLNVVTLVPRGLTMNPPVRGRIGSCFFRNAGLPVTDGMKVVDVLMSVGAEVQVEGQFRIHFEKDGPGSGRDIGLLVDVLNDIRTTIVPTFAHMF